MGAFPVARMVGVPDSSSDASMLHSGNAQFLEASHIARKRANGVPDQPTSTITEVTGSTTVTPDPVLTGKLQLLADGGAYFGGLDDDGVRSGCGVELLIDGSCTFLLDGSSQGPNVANILSSCKADTVDDNMPAASEIRFHTATGSKTNAVSCACAPFLDIMLSCNCFQCFFTESSRLGDDSAKGWDRGTGLAAVASETSMRSSESSIRWRQALLSSPSGGKNESTPLSRIRGWTKEVVLAWLCANGLEKHVHAFERAAITGAQLLALDHVALEVDLFMLRYGQRCEILAAINRLKEETLSRERSVMEGSKAEASPLAFATQALQLGPAVARSLHVRSTSLGEAAPTLYHGSFYGKEALVRILRGRLLDTLQMTSALEKLKSLRHPGLVLLLGSAVRPQATLMVSEAVSGCSLGAHFERAARVAGHLVAPTFKALLRIAQEVAAIMKFLHERQVWHLRLRPTHVLLDANLSVKIADYAVDALQCCMEVSLPNRIWDCCSWSSPEVLRAALLRNTARPVLSTDLDNPAAADVYSFGVILWELLACRRPFDDLSTAQLVLAVGLGRRRLPRLQHAGAAGALVHACTRYQSGKRPSFSEVIPVLQPSSPSAKAEAAHEAVAAFFG